MSKASEWARAYEAVMARRPPDFNPSKDIKVRVFPDGTAGLYIHDQWMAMLSADVAVALGRYLFDTFGDE